MWQLFVTLGVKERKIFSVGLVKVPPLVLCNLRAANWWKGGARGVYI